MDQKSKSTADKLAINSKRSSQENNLAEEDFYLNNDEDEDDDNYSENVNDEEMSELDDFLDEPMSSIVESNLVSKSSTGENSDLKKKTTTVGAQKGSAANEKKTLDSEDEFKYEVLTPDKIVQYMIECIKDVNQVLELNPTTTRILLHHFRWDKEKLMERFYDGDQDRLFKEAHIINPFKSLSKKPSERVIF
jgi:hypothetical protein